MREVSVQTITAATYMRAATRQIALRLLEADVAVHFITHGVQPDKEDEVFVGDALTLTLEFQSASPAIQCRLIGGESKQLIRRWFVSPSGAGMNRVVTTVKQHSAKKIPSTVPAIATAAAA